MRKVFLDTVGLLALWNVRDPWHKDAASAFAGLIAVGAELCTTSFVLLECGNASSRTPFRRDVVELREQLTANGELIEPTEAEINAAWAAYSKGYPGSPGIVDEISFAVMRRRQLTEAFTNDRHFREAGFRNHF